jgi:23S rRNA (uracil1939-C5)-methyltransferase
LKPQAAPEIADIVSLDHEGRGVTRIGGKAVFVHGALPGETVRLQRTRKRRRHDEAVVIEVLKPAPIARPRCAHFGTCGGCSLQHLAHPAQLVGKAAIVAEELARIGGVEPGRWLPPLSGPVWSYRRRARLGCKYVDKKERVFVGFRERGSPLLADRTGEVLAEPAGRLIEDLARLVGGLELRRRVAQIEVAVADNVTALGGADAAARRPGPAGVRRAINREYLQSGGLDTVTLSRRNAAALRTDGGCGIEFAPTDFIQVNGALNRLMVARAIELLDPRPADRALDLFCGLGNFTCRWRLGSPP